MRENRQVRKENA